MTPVIFRTERSGYFKGDVTACFPTIPGNPGMATCYAHVGQHGSYSWGWYRTTRLATPDEYADLLAELVSLGYDDLKIYKREISWMRNERYAAERELESGAERQAMESN
jgi:hypothetical protein